MGLAQPLAAVGQMQAHGSTRRFRVLPGDGLVDLLVLAAQTGLIVLLVVMGQARRVDPAAWNQGGAQVAHDVGEVAVAGGLGDLQMELEVRRHRIAGVGRALVQLIEKGAHGRQLLGRAALRGQTGRLHFQADAQFENRQQIAQGADGRRVDAQSGGTGGVQHEGADTVPRFHQPRGLQPRDRLAHHGAADTLGLHDGRLGRQLVAPLDHAIANLLRQFGDQFLGKTAMFAAGARLCALVFHGWRSLKAEATLIIAQQLYDNY